MDDGSTSCDRHRPPKGKTLLTIGQDLFSIRNYLDVQYNASLHEFLHNDHRDGRQRRTTTAAPPTLASVLPSTFMFYTDIQTLRGLDTPVEYGSGIEYADGLLEVTASVSSSAVATVEERRMAAQLQIGLWLNGTQGCRDILEGTLDAQLERLFAYLTSSRRCRRSCTLLRTTYLRVGYEFDNPTFGYDTDPIAYRQAFRYIVNSYRRRRRRQKEDTVVFVWHSWGAGLGNHHTLDDFYPGDDVVDWCGVSLFSQFFYQHNPSSSLGNLTTVETVLDFCTSHAKPIMIAESTPFGGIPSLNDPWNDWFQPVLDLISGHNHEHDIAMWSYIDCDWEAQPMWHTVGFGDTRLATNRTVLQLWRKHVLQNPRFLQAMDIMDSSTCSTPCTTTTTTTTTTAGMHPAASLPATAEAIVGYPQRPSSHQSSYSSSSSFVLMLVVAATTVAACGWILMVWIRQTLHHGQRTRLLRRLLRQRSEYGSTTTCTTTLMMMSNGDDDSGSAWRSSSMDALQHLAEGGTTDGTVASTSCRNEPTR